MNIKYRWEDRSFVLHWQSTKAHVRVAGKLEIDTNDGRKWIKQRQKEEGFVGGIYGSLI
jgi:hypothetical protein